MKELVIYYSRTGKTRYLCKEIQKSLNSEIVEIKDLVNRSGIFAYINYTLNRINKKDIEISPKELKLDDYDRIYIGTPVWASKPAPAITELIQKNNFKDKNIITIATFKNKGAQKAIKILNKLIQDKEGHVIKSYSIKTKNNNDFMKYIYKMINNLKN